MFLLSFTSFMEEFWNEFLVKLQTPWLWLGLLFMAIGGAVTICARRIARVCKRTDNISNTDGALITFKIIGLLFVIAGVIILIIV